MSLAAESELLTARGLSKTFGTFHALDQTSLSIKRGDILGVIGPNGAGKTTLLECIAGLLPADGGEVLWEGTPLTQELRKNVLFYMPDGIRPYADQTAASALDLFVTLFGAALDQSPLIERLGLEASLRNRVGELSKGTARRLLLALSILAPQPLLILDEPFDGLDPHQTRAVMELLRDVRAAGRTLILSIHQLTDAEKICDRFFLLSSGRAIVSGTLSELREKANISKGGLEDVFFALT